MSGAGSVAGVVQQDAGRMTWPVSGAWAIGILVGVKLLFSGMTMIAVGSAVKQATKR